MKFNPDQYILYDLHHGNVVNKTGSLKQSYAYKTKGHFEKLWGFKLPVSLAVKAEEN